MVGCYVALFWQQIINADAEAVTNFKLNLYFILCTLISGFN